MTSLYLMVIHQQVHLFWVSAINDLLAEAFNLPQLGQSFRFQFDGKWAHIVCLQPSDPQTENLL